MSDSKVNIAESGVTTLPMFIGATMVSVALGLCLIGQTIIDGTVMVYGTDGFSRWPSEWVFLFSKPWLSLGLGAFAGIAFDSGLKRFDEARSDVVARWLDEILNSTNRRRPLGETVLLVSIGAVIIVCGGMLAPMTLATSPYIFLFSFIGVGSLFEYSVTLRRAHRVTEAIEKLGLTDEERKRCKVWIKSTHRKTRPFAYLTVILVPLIAIGSVAYSMSLREYFADLDARHTQVLESAGEQHPAN